MSVSPAARVDVATRTSPARTAHSDGAKDPSPHAASATRSKRAASKPSAGEDGPREGAKQLGTVGKGARLGRTAGTQARTGADTAREQVKVVTINVKAFQGSRAGDVDERAFDAIERYIERVDPDVVLFQELDDGTRRSGGQDQLAEIARRVNATDSEFGKAIDHDGGQYGVGVLTRNGHRIKDDAAGRNRTELVKLPRATGDGADSEQRVALVAPIETPGGEEFSAVSTHVTNESKGRGEQLDRIDDIVRDLRGGSGDRSAGLADDLPDTVVLGGDFNTGRDDVEEHVGNDVRHAAALDEDLGDTGIDHVYVSEGVSVVDSGRDEPERIHGWLPFGTGGERATDHPAIQATLLLP